MTVSLRSETPPKLSVVMAAYNRARDIEEAVDSVLAQDYEDFELIVVDDGSKDDTGEVLEKYGDEIRYVRKPNGGVGSARNTGINAARGEYLAYCDADDKQYPFRLGAQVEVLDRFPDVGLVFTDFDEWIDGKEVTGKTILHNRWLGPSKRTFREDIDAHFSEVRTCADLGISVPEEHGQKGVYTGRIDRMLAQIHAAWGCVLMGRTRVIREVGGHWEDIRAFEDWVLSCEIAKRYDLAYMDLPTCLYRVHADQLTGRARLNAECYLDSLHYVWKSDPVFYGKHRDIIDDALATAHAILGEVEAVDGNWALAEENFKKAIRWSPLQGKRRYVNLLLSSIKRRVPLTRHGLLARVIPGYVGQSANAQKQTTEEDWNQS